MHEAYTNNKQDQNPHGVVATIGSDRNAVMPAIKAAILRELDQEDRLLLILKYAEDMSTPEIAAILQSTAQHVTAQLSRIQSHLRLIADEAIHQAA